MHKVIYGCTLLFASSIANAELLINSPVQVCDILVTQGLSTRGWIDNYGYGCSSNYPNSSPKCDTLQFKRLASFLQKPWLAA